jgi:hypothetical protein
MGRRGRGDPRAARRWNEQYLALTFSTGRYVPYESLVVRAAEMRGLDLALAQRLTQAYGQLRPWPEVPRVLAAIAATMPIGTVTNYSDELGHQAAGLVGVPFEVTVTAQSSGAGRGQFLSRVSSGSLSTRCRKKSGNTERNHHQPAQNHTAVYEETRGWHTDR